MELLLASPGSRSRDVAGANRGVTFLRYCLQARSPRGRASAILYRAVRLAAGPVKTIARQPLTQLPMPKGCNNRLCSVRKSAIHGRGVFAVRKIRKGTRILEYKGKRTSWAEATGRPDSDPKDPTHTFLFELDDGTVIDAGVGGNTARWVNHSCEPNCAAYEDEVGRVFIEAQCKILPGEELTYDYHLTVGGRLSRRERVHYVCHCFAAKCRGSLLGKPR